MPGTVFIYGETGWPSGGRIRPHRTHQNGLSVDFMVPVVDPDGASVLLPGNAFNRFGYDEEFDADGQSGALIIFDPQYLPSLFITEHFHVDFSVPCDPLAG